MKVFISWSGDRSHAVAEILSDWIKCVIQATEPWLSSRDIDRGALWFTEINEQLGNTAVGILCVTQENKERPWILFEAGALAKGLSSSRVCPFLIDLHSSDLKDTLGQFNHSMPNKQSMWQLVKTINTSLTDSSRLDERILQKTFDTYWGQFKSQFDEALTVHPALERTEPKSQGEILEQILNTTRNIQGRVSQLETRLSKISGPPSTDTKYTPAFEKKIWDSVLQYMREGKSESLALEAASLTLGIGLNTVIDCWVKMGQR